VRGEDDRAAVARLQFLEVLGADEIQSGTIPSSLWRTLSAIVQA